MIIQMAKPTTVRAMRGNIVAAKIFPVEGPDESFEYEAEWSPDDEWPPLVWGFAEVKSVPVAAGPEEVRVTKVLAPPAGSPASAVGAPVAGTVLLDVLAPSS